MKLVTLGGLRPNFFKKAIAGIPLPQNLTIAVVADQHRCWALLKHYPAELRKKFFELCTYTKTSFSFSRDGKHYVLIYVPSKNSPLAKNPAVFRGLLLHELVHIRLRNHQFYATIPVRAREVYAAFAPRIPKQYEQIFRVLQSSAQLFLRDIYSNSTLMRSKHVDDVLAYYKAEFSRRVCPKPVFYTDLQSMLKKNPAAIIGLLQFEFGLLSITLPLQKFKRAHAVSFLRHMERCYQVNAREVQQGCEQIVELYLRSKKLDTVFQHLFFTSVFLQVLAWIDHPSWKK